MWRVDDPQGNEAQKVKYDIVRWTRGRGLDIGCGPSKCYPHMLGVDNMHHAAEFGWQYKPDVVSEADDLSIFADRSQDFVFSSHTLEHVVDPGKTLREWFRVIKVGGYLVLYLPHKDFYPRCGQPGANPDHKSDFDNKDVTELMRAIPGWELVLDEERNYDHGPGCRQNEYSFLQVYKKLDNKAQVIAVSKPKKRAAVVRYGGFGDMIQASSILPGLKKEGYHITVYTTPRGEQILRHDPHVDDFHIQDTDQVENSELGAFWQSQSKYYDRFINLSESIEGGLLAMPGRILHQYSKAARDKICNVNYWERTHDIAGVPFRAEGKFYPTDEEKAWAKKQRKEIGGDFLLVWCLSGSALHKVSYWTDYVVMRLLSVIPGIRIVFTGDYACQILEGCWDNEPRVFPRSGVWSIRECMAFAQVADCIVGPETGLLNAMAYEDIPKVIALSHSTQENLTKHWRRTISLIPEKTECYPCHMMHYGRGSCQYKEVCDGENKADMPACTYEINTEMWYDAIMKVRQWQLADQPIIASHA